MTVNLQTAESKNRNTFVHEGKGQFIKLSNLRTLYSVHGDILCNLRSYKQSSFITGVLSAASALQQP